MHRCVCLIWCGVTINTIKRNESWIFVSCLGFCGMIHIVYANFSDSRKRFEVVDLFTLLIWYVYRANGPITETICHIETGWQEIEKSKLTHFSNVLTIKILDELLIQFHKKRRKGIFSCKTLLTFMTHYHSLARVIISWMVPQKGNSPAKAVLRSVTVQIFEFQFQMLEHGWSDNQSSLNWNISLQLRHKALKY